MSSEIVLCLLLTTLITESIQQSTSSSAPVNGGWTSWTDSGSCSVTCGKGSIFRLRFCKNPKPQHGGEDCQGVPFERQECQNTPCPVDGQWGAWSGFSNCSVKCGNGTKTRTRSCDNPAPQNGGLKCAGNESEAIVCSTSDCAVDGGWGPWISSGRSCSVTCGRGSVLRIRSCTNPTPSNGGQDCPGAPFQSSLCQQPECPVDGGWGPWISSGRSCSVTCGRGSVLRIRSCTNPTPSNGGQDCPGAPFQSSLCQQPECPEMN